MPKPPGSGLQIRPRAPHLLHLSVCLRKASLSKQAACLSANANGTVKRCREAATLRPCNALERNLFCAISQMREVMPECRRCRRSHGSPQRFARKDSQTRRMGRANGSGPKWQRPTKLRQYSSLPWEQAFPAELCCPRHLLQVPENGNGAGE
jgi:hypothetical protein